MPSPQRGEVCCSAGGGHRFAAASFAFTAPRVTASWIASGLALVREHRDETRPPDLRARLFEQFVRGDDCAQPRARSHTIARRRPPAITYTSIVTTMQASTSTRIPFLVLTLLVLLLPACTREAPAFTPGLGEIMSLQQMRHGKLWFAGQAANWELCAYETDELEEGFADAMHFHPTHKTSPQPLTQAVPAYTDEPVKALRSAIAAKDRGRFEQAFDQLTAGCNGCHQATSFAFNVVIRPRQNNYSNQDFAAPGK